MGTIDKDNVCGISALDANDLLFEFFSDVNFEYSLNEMFDDEDEQEKNAIITLRNTFGDLNTEEQKRAFLSAIINLIQFGDGVDPEQFEYYNNDTFLECLANDLWQAFKDVNPATIALTFAGSTIANFVMNEDNSVKFGVVASLYTLLINYVLNFIFKRVERKGLKPSDDDLEFFHCFAEQLKQYNLGEIPVNPLAILLEQLIAKRNNKY